MSDDLLPDLLAAVDQQLASPQTKYVTRTFERLISKGLEESEAKRQIALCLGEQLDEMVRKRRGFDEKAYRESLDGLPMEEGEGAD
jgi:hypothetical protein